MSERSTCVLIAVLAAGLLMSAYLTWVHLLGVSPICLAGSGGCEAVQSSRYAEIWGICQWCVASAALMSAAFVLSVIRVGQLKKKPVSSPRPPDTPCHEEAVDDYEVLGVTKESRAGLS